MASLEPDDLELLRGENYAWFVTLDPDGSPAASITWVDADERHVLVNTAEGRRKDRNAAHDPRVVVAVQAFDDAYRWISRGGRRRGAAHGARGRRAHRLVEPSLRPRAVDAEAGAGPRALPDPSQEHRSVRLRPWPTFPSPRGCAPGRSTEFVGQTHLVGPGRALTKLIERAAPALDHPVGSGGYRQDHPGAPARRCGRRRPDAALGGLLRRRPTRAR